MGSCENGWILDYCIMDDVPPPDFIWDPRTLNDQTVGSDSFGLEVPCNEEKACQAKRARVESCSGTGTKACREKMRRDKLNDRFLELSLALDPRRPLKTDKVVILRDATRLLNHLRIEAQRLKELSKELQDTIKNLKAEKTELRDEKMKLKTEKESMEQLLRCMSIPPPFMSHPALAAATAFHAAAFASTNKTMPYPNYPRMTMWQWMPPASFDTSQDHVLRPPVA